MRRFLSECFKVFCSVYAPRYSLRIAERVVGDDDVVQNYKVMAAGEHRPITLIASEILFGKRIKETLPPDDLLLVMNDFIKEKSIASRYHIKEINRDGTYLLENKSHAILISGEEFCRNIELVEQTNPIDIFHIISDVQFKAGRISEKELLKSQSKLKNAPSVVLKVVQ